MSFGFVLVRVRVRRRLKRRYVSSTSSDPRTGGRRRVESSGRAAEDRLDESSEAEGVHLDCDDGFGAVISDEMRRTSIATTFVNIFDAPPECEWAEREGTVSEIMQKH